MTNNYLNPNYSRNNRGSIFIVIICFIVAGLLIYNYQQKASKFNEIKQEVQDDYFISRIEELINYVENEYRGYLYLNKYPDTDYIIFEIPEFGSVLSSTLGYVIVDPTDKENLQFIVSAKNWERYIINYNFTNNGKPEKLLRGDDHFPKNAYEACKLYKDVTCYDRNHNVVSKKAPEQTTKRKQGLSEQVFWMNVNKSISCAQNKFIVLTNYNTIEGYGNYFAADLADFYGDNKDFKDYAGYVVVEKTDEQGVFKYHISIKNKNYMLVDYIYDYSNYDVDITDKSQKFPSSLYDACKKAGATTCYDFNLNPITK